MNSNSELHSQRFLDIFSILHNTFELETPLSGFLAFWSSGSGNFVGLLPQFLVCFVLVGAVKTKQHSSEQGDFSVHEQARMERCFAGIFFSSVIRSWWWSFLPPVVSNFKKLLMCVDVLEYVFSARVGYQFLKYIYSSLK